MERFGVRRVVAAALALVAAGSRADPGDDQPLAAVAALGLRRSASAPARWRWSSARSSPTAGSCNHRGVVTGLFSAASSTGQLIFLPVIANLAARPGLALGRRAVAVFSPLLVPCLAGAARPTHRHRRAAVRRDRATSAASTATDPGAARVAIEDAARGQPQPDLLGRCSCTFWICGWSTNGLIGTHFIPAAHDHGMPETTSAGLLALIGVFDIVGTVASGWLTDRVDRRYLLVRLLLLARAVAARRAGAARPARPPEPVPVHRVLRPRLGRDGAADGRAVPDPLRHREVGRRLRLGVRLAHGRRRRRGVVRRLDPAGPRRLLRARG